MSSRPAVDSRNGKDNLANDTRGCATLPDFGGGCGRRRQISYERPGELEVATNADYQGKYLRGEPTPRLLILQS